MLDPVEQVVQVVVSDYERYLATCPVVAQRDQHAEQHCTLRGTLTVRVPEVPYKYRHGLFADSATHDVIARWSPNATLPRDAHGMAVKVMAGQDFLLCSSRTFFAKDTKACLELMQAKSKGTIPALAWYFVRGRRWREAMNMVKAISKRVSDPLRIDYFSPTAMMCGPNVVRVAAIAWQSKMADATFDLCLQDCPADLIDDPTRPCKTPLVPVGVLHFSDQQSIDGEALSFNVGNHVVDHAPIGQIPLLRQPVYAAISSMRREYNKRRT